MGLNTGLQAGLKRWWQQRRRRPSCKVIVVGIDYPSHQLIQAMQRDPRLQVVAAIDDYPWNHRTRILDVPVHYPSEIAALAARHGVRDLLVFAGAADQLDAGLRAELLAQRLHLHELDDDAAPQQLIATLCAARQR